MAAKKKKTASPKKPSKKPSRTAATKPKKTAAQYEAEIADLGERLNISQFRFSSLATAVESERSLGRVILNSFEDLQARFNSLIAAYNELAKKHDEAVASIDVSRDEAIKLDGKVEGMMAAYQHALETVTDNLATNMVIQGEMTSVIPPEG